MDTLDGSTDFRRIVGALAGRITALTVRADRAEAEADRAIAMLAAERNRSDGERARDRADMRAGNAEAMLTGMLEGLAKAERDATELRVRLSKGPE